jgi:excisionase family DNA binding protein
VTTQPTPAEVPRIAPDRLYGYKEAAEVLGLNRYLIRNMMRDGRIPSIRINDRGDRRVRGRDLLDWMDAGGVQ